MNEDARRIGDLTQALLEHLEDANLAQGSKAVLDRAQQPIGAAVLALEVQHGVDHVFEHLGPGDVAIFGDMPDHEGRDVETLGDFHHDLGRLPDLRDRAGRSRVGFGIDRLDRVDHDQVWPEGFEAFPDVLEQDLGLDQQVGRTDLEALAPELELGGRLLATDIQHAAAALGQSAGHLQHEGRFADAGIAAHQHQRAGHDAAAQHAVEFGDAARKTREVAGRDRREGYRRVERTFGLDASLELDLLFERVPFSAGRTASQPLLRGGAAGLTTIDAVSLGHYCWVTLKTSSMVVRPSSTLRAPSWRRVCRPSLMAWRLITFASEVFRMVVLIVSVIIRIS
ncbi:MAG: hypothetical protein BWY87_01398 [Deltaproteobacteria bacterium ADurb.Bin510]|nr:MAG: hypothetical protein BWY87_01398 [Deltaproteobacteria bacterium ADurb.Bin510]